MWGSENNLPFSSNIFTAFLSFLLFYLLFFVFLRKSKIFDTRERKAPAIYYSLISLLISALSVYSLSSLGLLNFLPILSGVFVVIVFFFTYFYGILKHSVKTLEVVGENYDVLESKIKLLISEYENTKKEEVKKEIKKLLEKITILSKKLGKNIENEEWYKKAKEIVG